MGESENGEWAHLMQLIPYISRFPERHLFLSLETHIIHSFTTGGYFTLYMIRIWSTHIFTLSQEKWDGWVGQCNNVKITLFVASWIWTASLSLIGNIRLSLRKIIIFIIFCKLADFSKSLGQIADFRNL